MLNFALFLYIFFNYADRLHSSILFLQPYYYNDNIMSKTPIPESVKRDLWFAAHGRCEFAGCNKILFNHGVTMDECNISNYAHIIADSPNGPRGDKSKSPEYARDISNLILLCPDCHRLIDSHVEKYTVEVVRKMKKEHEERILRVTSIQPDMKSLVVVYGPKVGTDTPHFHKDVLFNTIFPERYPADCSPVEIQMKNSVMIDGEDFFWNIESRQIEEICQYRIIDPLVRGEISHVSLFALGPQPLLVKLGTLLNDKYPVTVYQKHRIPDSWRWLEEDTRNEIRLIEPSDKTKEPILVIALSAKAIWERTSARFGGTVSLWVITCDKPDNDMMRTYAQFVQFNQVARSAMDAIKTAHPSATCLKIFMAAPASCAVELGRIRMPKADLPWELYDYWREKEEDVKTLTIK